MRGMIIAVSVTFVAGVVACTIEPPPPAEMDQNATSTLPEAGAENTKDAGTSTKGGSTEKGKEAPDTCPYTGTPVDVTPFAVCLGAGRCVPEAVVPANERTRLAECPTKENAKGFCVPEKIIANKGLFVPKTCASLAGGEGRCVSRVFPDIEKQKDNLPKDVCEESERCAPCFDPISGAETGACRSVACDQPAKPKVVFGECCKESGKARGRCLPTSSIPEANRSNLDVKECAAGDAERCVPAETLAPNYAAPKCRAFSIVGSYDGVCISNCVRKDFLTNIGTAQGNCADESFCAPCKNPFTGAPTGAPGCQ